MKGGRELDIRLKPLEELVIAQVQHRRIAAQNHGGVVHITHVDLRQSPGQLQVVVEAAQADRLPFGDHHVDR